VPGARDFRLCYSALEPGCWSPPAWKVSGDLSWVGDWLRGKVSEIEADKDGVAWIMTLNEGTGRYDLKKAETREGVFAPAHLVVSSLSAEDCYQKAAQAGVDIKRPPPPAPEKAKK
jgi:hypothetical protein